METHHCLTYEGNNAKYSESSSRNTANIP